jgi:UDP-N-acetylmuramyl pentapeptide phosphotransferase/UDP-N-acetylglucosamine-1-phosphate transferase
MDVGGRRKIHKGFTPSMGGIAIFIGFLAASIFWIPPSYWLPYKFLIFACCVIFFTGLRDDLVELSPKMKLMAQFLAIAMIMWNGGNDAGSIRISSFYGFLGIDTLPMWASYVVTAFVIVVITNAFNLIDGLDGLAGTLGLLMFTLLATWFLLVGNADNNVLTVGIFAVAIIGSILAFLCFNWHPASIFMGDTGSLFLGFFLSILAIKFLCINGDHNFVSDFKINAPISMAIAICIIPLLDTGRVFVMRISQHRSPFSPDKLHIHHLLMRMGLSHPKVVVVMSVLYLCFVGLMMFLSHYFTDNVLVPFILLLCIELHFALRRIVHFVFNHKHNKIRELLLKKT